MPPAAAYTSSSSWVNSARQCSSKNVLPGDGTTTRWAAIETCACATLRQVLSIRVDINLHGSFTYCICWSFTSPYWCPFTHLRTSLIYLYNNSIQLAYTHRSTWKPLTNPVTICLSVCPFVWLALMSIYSFCRNRLINYCRHQTVDRWKMLVLRYRWETDFLLRRSALASFRRTRRCYRQYRRQKYPHQSTNDTVRIDKVQITYG